MIPSAEYRFNNREMPRIGVVGLGYWGKNILRNLYELKILHTACDINPCVIEEKRREFHNVNFTTSSEDVLTDPEIDAVAICTPAATHHELASRALRADKDVFIEKPLALTAKHGKELVDLARDRKRILMVGHILQYHPAVIKLKDLIEKGKLGNIYYLYSNRLNIGRLRTEENIIWSFAPHDISVILMLVGENPLKVEYFKAEYLNKGISDVTLSILNFNNGVKGHIFVSWLHPFKEQKLVVVGSKAMAVFDDLAEEKLSIYPHTIEWQNGNMPVANKAKRYIVDLDKKEPLKEELKHFAECVLNRTTPKTDGEEGLRVLKILEESEDAAVYQLPAMPTVNEVLSGKTNL
jgi:UDP-2-acetamido-3-amino-2,3-dideoxy-glucuronate N-acetyltransferase